MVILINSYLLYNRLVSCFIANNLVKNVIKPFFLNRHVHGQCDIEANESYILDKRLTQPTFMFVCKVCKGTMKSALTIPGNGTTNSNSGVSRTSFGGDDSNGADGDGGSDFGDEGGSGRIGMGKGKPFAAISQSGKRRRFGIVGRPRGGGVGGNGIPVMTNWKGLAANKPNEVASSSAGASSSGMAGSASMSSAAVKKRLGEVRRRGGRQPKIRGMVGLQVFTIFKMKMVDICSFVYLFI